ncbi:uncharacterized protein [Narcine bancroftii]|uniref:uncharacterized protein isoform X2 n=1 Tax=Narcine bancroftii TaxID=1343680 RepID=UPI0038313901
MGVKEKGRVRRLWRRSERHSRLKGLYYAGVFNLSSLPSSECSEQDTNQGADPKEPEARCPGVTPAGGADKIDILEELMARCWHNEPGQRPAFKEVVMSTGAVLRAHRGKVLDAVHHVLSNLNRQPRDDVFEQPVFTRTLGPSAGIHQSTRKLLKEGKLGPSGLPGPVPSEGPMMAAWMPPLAEVRDKVVEHLRVGVNEDQAISEEKQSPPLSWMRQESGEGNLSYTTQRNLPKPSRWSSVKILLLESWMENMQIGSRNTMKVIQRGRRK